MEMMPELLTTFAPYLLAYTDIAIKYDGATIDPAQHIKKQNEKELRRQRTSKGAGYRNYLGASTVQ